MFNTTFKMKNERKDSNVFKGDLQKDYKVCEIFSALTSGRDVSKYGHGTDKTMEYVQGLGERANNGDIVAISEMNTLRRFEIESPVLEKMRLLSVFGRFEQLDFDDSIEREVWTHVGEFSRPQANRGDVVYPKRHKVRYTVPSQTISGGYSFDYRRLELGDMSKENEGMEIVQTDILNRAIQYVMINTYNSIESAEGVKFDCVGDHFTKAGYDALISKVRRFGKPTLVGDFALVSQVADFAGYQGTTPSVMGISEKAMNEIAAKGYVTEYKGTIITDIPNPYNTFEYDEEGDNFATLYPQGLGFCTPAGGETPVMSWTRGGLTSFTGNNVKDGSVETRFDLEVATDVAKGHEYEIGVVYDKSLGGLDV